MACTVLARVIHSLKQYLLNAFRCLGTVLRPSCTVVRTSKVYILMCWGGAAVEQTVVTRENSNSDPYYKK